MGPDITNSVQIYELIDPTASLQYFIYKITMNSFSLTFENPWFFPISKSLNEFLHWCIPSPRYIKRCGFVNFLFSSGALCFIVLKSLYVKFLINYQEKNKGRHRLLELESILEITDAPL